MKAGNLLDLGVRRYDEVWELQRKLVDLRARKQIPDTLILVQHPHVFTVGKAVLGEIPSKIDGVPVVRIERGGQWTYHGPGQLVGYPILDLDARNRDVHAFVYGIEEALILALGVFGINAGRMEGRDKAGVWIGSRKIASIGAAIRNWVTYHGFAMNVNTDMRYFAMIEPCGMPSSTMTSMRIMLGRDVDFDGVKISILQKFTQVFQVDFSSVREADLPNAPLK
jgi:lipoate-protein ligase B